MHEASAERARRDHEASTERARSEHGTCTKRARSVHEEITEHARSERGACKERSRREHGACRKGAFVDNERRLIRDIRIATNVSILSFILLMCVTCESNTKKPRMKVRINLKGNNRSNQIID